MDKSISLSRLANYEYHMTISNLSHKMQTINFNECQNIENDLDTLSNRKDRAVPLSIYTWYICRNIKPLVLYIKTL